MDRDVTVRGPASLYYGAAQPGGVFNYNYKRPRADDPPRTSLENLA